eukprot:EG_transcript_2585
MENLPELASSPSSITESIGVSSLASLMDAKYAHRYNWCSHLISPAVQHAAGKVVSVLLRCLPDDVLSTLPDEIFDKLVSELLGLMRCEEAAAEGSDLQQQMDRLLRQFCDSDEKSQTIARLTGLLEAKEEEVKRMHVSWVSMNEVLQRKEAQRREAEVQLASMQGELGAVRAQLRQQEAAAEDLREVVQRLQQGAPPQPGDASPREGVEEPQPGHRRTPTPPSASHGARRSSIDEDDFVQTLLQQLAMAEDECRRQAKLTEKYRQLAHAKDQELCAQAKLMETDAKAMQVKLQQQLQDSKQAHTIQVAALVAELETCQRQLEEVKVQFAASLAGSSQGDSPMHQRLMAAVEGPPPSTTPATNGTKAMPSPGSYAAARSRSPAPHPLPRHHDGSSSASPVSSLTRGCASPDGLEPRSLQLSPDGRDPGGLSLALSLGPLHRPASRSNSVAYSLSSLSDSGSDGGRSDLLDASTQVEVSPAPALAKRPQGIATSSANIIIHDVTRTRRVSGPMPGYRNRSLTIPVPTPTAPEQTSTAREKLLASMGRLPLHKLQDLDGTEDAQQGSASAPNSARSVKSRSSRPAHLRAPSSSEPPPARITPPAAGTMQSPRLSATSSTGSVPFQRKTARVRSATTGSVPAKGASRQITVAPKKVPGSPTRAKAKALVVYFPHPLPSPRHAAVDGDARPGAASVAASVPAPAQTLGAGGRGASTRSNSHPLMTAQKHPPTSSRRGPLF